METNLVKLTQLTSSYHDIPTDDVDNVTSANDDNGEEQQSIDKDHQQEEEEEEEELVQLKTDAYNGHKGILNGNSANNNDNDDDNNNDMKDEKDFDLIVDDAIGRSTMALLNEDDIVQPSTNLIENVTSEHVKTQEEIEEEILSILDGDNNIVVKELDDEDATKMIQTQKQYEKYKKWRRGHEVWDFLSKIKLIIFNILFFCLGVTFAEVFLLQLEDDTLYLRCWFYTSYLSFLLLWISVGRFVTWLIMLALRKYITNSWTIFYITGK